MSTRLTVAITYCRRCNFLPRALWTAHELLHTFGDYIAELRLVPAGGGDFDVDVDGERIFSRRAAGRYPEIAELKEALAARLDPAEAAGLKRHPHRPTDQ
ncbi:Rdx family protein [Tepidiforma flava]|uniref:Rdx family protein n=1 Tax=Tepidiforma flava TaxID=3004094 RepID=A0ABY7M8Y8_9CHLR|nr:Rdx family protein [Tepidiforma flava]WBL36565.1 Rdx family protein [Tepidiforma flava]